MEELGVEIEVLRPPALLAPLRYGDDGQYAIAIGFLAEITSGEPSPSDDVSDLLWIPRSGVDALDFAWEHDREFVRTALQGNCT